MPIADFDQPQREALIGLLIGATYGDSHLSLDEMDAYQSMVDSLPWDSGTTIELFQDTATAAARTAHESDTAEAFIAEKAKAFDTPATKATALDLFVHLLDADGTTGDERGLLAAARKALG